MQYYHLARWRQWFTNKRQRGAGQKSTFQVPVDDVMLVDVVNTLQNLMYTVAAKARKERSVQGKTIHDDML